jgi:hypothetical protein
MYCDHPAASRQIQGNPHSGQFVVLERAILIVPGTVMVKNRPEVHLLRTSSHTILFAVWQMD